MFSGALFSLAIGQMGTTNGDRLLFSCADDFVPPIVVPHATHPSRSNRWSRLSRPQTRERRRRSFHKDTDYSAFLDLLATAKAKHLVKELGSDAESFSSRGATGHSRCVERLHAVVDDSHVRRYHRHYRSHGHVWQGRFKSFPIQQDSHLLTVLRYVLRYPVRAGIVKHAAQWPRSSLRMPHLVDAPPIPLPEEVPKWIDQPLLALELTALRTCVNRQQPFGSPEWKQQLASTLGLASTLRPRGRPPKFK